MTALRFSSRVQGVGLSMIRQIMLKAPPGCINLGIGEPDAFAPNLVREEAQRILAEEKILYSPNAGVRDLCRLIHEYHGGHPGHAVCVTNGSQEAFFDLFFALVEVGDEALIPDPGFPAYRTVVEMAGATAVPYPLTAASGFHMDTGTLVSLMTERTKICLINSPSNPTGQSLSADELAGIVEACRERGILLVSDEIYREIYFTEQPSTIMDFSQEAVVLSGMSKMAAMTGWRVGWACGPQEIINKTTVMHQYTSSCASTLAQKASIPLFTDAGKQAVALERQRLGRNREYLQKWVDGNFPESRGFLPDGAFYMLLDVRDWERPTMDLALDLLNFKVATIPGSAFGREGEGFLRISFAGDFEALALGLDRLKSALLRLRD